MLLAIVELVEELLVITLFVVVPFAKVESVIVVEITPAFIMSDTITTDDDMVLLFAVLVATSLLVITASVVVLLVTSELVTVEVVT